MGDNTFKMTAGQRYNRLVSIRPHESDRPGRRRWVFQCDCGNTLVSLTASVRIKDTQSCGCLHRENVANLGRSSKKHGLSKMPEYFIWCAMWQRCTDPKIKKFERYGARGITICERWKIFENFLADMGPRPSKEYSIDRVNNDGNYEPANCRWATRREQQRNRHMSRFVDFQGRKMTIAEAAEISGIKYETIRSRLARGLDEEAVFAL